MSIRSVFLLTLMAIGAGSLLASEETKSPFDFGWIDDVRFIAYCPTGFDPRPDRGLLPSSLRIKGDLRRVRRYCDGLVLYSCSPPVRDIMRVAAKLRFKGVVLGVWNPENRDELETCIKLCEEWTGLVRAVCIGNEGLTFSRYTEDQLEQAFNLLRSRLPLMPLGTSEPISAYGNLRLQNLPDVHMPNVHPVFGLNQSADIGTSVDWVIERVTSLQEITGKPVLCKETGFPSGGDARFTPGLQEGFWARLFAASSGPRSRELEIGFVCFEAFDLPWKAETSGLPFEGFWGFWDAQRKRKPVLDAFDELRH